MAEYHAVVTVNAPVHQVYTLFTHFHDFPKFMSFIKEVSYYDDQRSHWVAHIGADFSWDAINENWIPDQQVGWRSIGGLENLGKVTFQPLTEQTTTVNVFLHVTVPGGRLGNLAEGLGIGSHFEQELQNDLNRFAQMVEKAPPGSLDPMQSSFLFHCQSSVAKGTATERQHEFMDHDPTMSREALHTREAMLEHQQAEKQEHIQQEKAHRKQEAEKQERAAREQAAVLQHQKERDIQQAQQEQAVREPSVNRPEPHPVYDTIGGRHAATPRTPLGDQDARRERFADTTTDPMMGRSPDQVAQSELERQKQESPWDTLLHKKSAPPQQEEKPGQMSQEEASIERQE